MYTRVYMYFWPLPWSWTCLQALVFVLHNSRDIYSVIHSFIHTGPPRSDGNRYSVVSNRFKTLEFLELSA
jgi:hypothetical protein